MAEPRGAAGRLAYLLKHIAEGASSFTLKDLTARAALPSSTVHRLLQELVRSGLIERGAGQAYRPGRELYLLASRLVGKFDLVRCARPHLEQLRDSWTETVVLCAYCPAGRNAVIADAVPSTQPLRHAIGAGDVIELPWGSLGKAILASLPFEHRAALLKEQTTGPITGRPLPPALEMEANLASIRALGWAWHCDMENDLAGIAAPVFGRGDDVLGCVGVAMRAGRFGFHADDGLSKAVRDAAVAISDRARIAYS